MHVLLELTCHTKKTEMALWFIYLCAVNGNDPVEPTIDLIGYDLVLLKRVRSCSMSRQPSPRLRHHVVPILPHTCTSLLSPPHLSRWPTSGLSPKDHRRLHGLCPHTACLWLFRTGLCPASTAPGLTRLAPVPLKHTVAISARHTTLGPVCNRLSIK